MSAPTTADMRARAREHAVGVADLPALPSIHAVPPMQTFAEAFNRLAQEMRSDDSYAWAWHCNLAMSFYDEGMPPSAANRGAARFMRLMWDVDTSKNERFADTQGEPK